MIKVMTGYHGFTMERSPGNDAFVPILADGLKWMGYFPEQRIFFSLGGFGDEIGEDEKFMTYDYQGVTRIGWLPVASEAEKMLWHVAVMSRFGRPDEGKILFRSKPEDSLGPFFVETPTIESPRSRYFFSRRTRSGNSSRQGTHQVAQKFTRTTRPFSFAIA